VRTSFFVVGAALLLTSCGDDANDQGRAGRRLAEHAPAAASPTTEPPAVEPSGVTVQVLAIDNTFRPEVIEVQVGDEVLWENRGLNEHDVLYVEDSASPFGVEAAQFQPGDVYTHVFSEPGEFRYYCSIHGNETVGMVGTVVVSG
jgi:plastocyanin